MTASQIAEKAYSLSQAIELVRELSEDTVIIYGHLDDQIEIVGNNFLDEANIYERTRFWIHRDSLGQWEIIDREISAAYSFTAEYDDRGWVFDIDSRNIEKVTEVEVVRFPDPHQPNPRRALLITIPTPIQ